LQRHKIRISAPEFAKEHQFCLTRKVQEQTIAARINSSASRQSQLWSSGGVESLMPAAVNL
jgi:hypothetical protein